MYRLEFELPGLPPTTNGSHGHWRTAGASRKKWREATRLVASPKRPKEPLTKANLILTRHSPKRADFDNRVISFKSVVDGLIDAGIILNDDDDVILERKYLWVKASPKKGKITVVVEAA